MRFNVAPSFNTAATRYRPPHQRDMIFARRAEKTRTQIKKQMTFDTTKILAAATPEDRTKEAAAFADSLKITDLAKLPGATINSLKAALADKGKGNAKHPKVQNSGAQIAIFSHNVHKTSPPKKRPKPRPVLNGLL